MVTVARSHSPWGPFDSHPANPILSHRSIASPIQSTGHADLVELSDGTWWAVLLGTRPVGQLHHLGRETFLTPVHWTDDGWPVLGEDGRVLSTHQRPALAPQEPVDLDTRDDFDEPELDSQWNTLRRPATDNLSLKHRPGWLTLTGRPGSVSSPDLMFVGRRQQHLRFAVATTVDAHPSNGEAGLMVRMDERHHAELAIVERAGDRLVVFRRQTGDLVVEQFAHAPDGALVLNVTADERFYEFSWRSDHEIESTSLPRLEVRYLSSEVAGGFTGVFIGLYAAGADAAAAFARFDYVGEPTHDDSKPAEGAATVDALRESVPHPGR